MDSYVNSCSQVIEPRAKNTPVNQEQLSRAKAGLQVALDQVESIFLKENPYISGKEISIADLLCICELMQPWAGGFDINEGRPKLAAYVERVRQRLEPHFTEANVVVEAVRDAVLKARIWIQSLSAIVQFVKFIPAFDLTGH